MADVPADFDSDLTGSTVHFSGTAAAGFAKIPAAPGNILSEVTIENTHLTADLHVSFDGGTLFHIVEADGALTWTPKGRLTQFDVKSPASATFQGIYNLEAS